jgi:hypothetical protein
MVIIWEFSMIDLKCVFVNEDKTQKSGKPENKDSD